MTRTCLVLTVALNNLLPVTLAIRVRVVLGLVRALPSFPTQVVINFCIILGPLLRNRPCMTRVPLQRLRLQLPQQNILRPFRGRLSPRSSMGR